MSDIEEQVEEQPAETSKVYKALHGVMSRVSYVQKDDRNEFHRYNYASEGALLKALRPAMIAEGIILIPSVTDVRPIDQFGNTVVQMEYTVVHESGEVLPHKIQIFGCGNDKNSKGGVGDKGIYKAMTGANKYLLFKLFQIETGDDPEIEHSGGDGAQNEHAPLGKVKEKKPSPTEPEDLPDIPFEDRPFPGEHDKSHSREDVEPFEGQVSAQQVKFLYVNKKKHNWNDDDFYLLIHDTLKNGTENPNALSKKQFAEVLWSIAPETKEDIRK